MANLDGGAPAHDEGGVVLPTQTARVHVRPQADIVAQHVGDTLLCADVVDFDALTRTYGIKSQSCLITKGLPHELMRTTLLAQAMRLVLHWTLVIVPSPSWRRDVFQRFIQLRSYKRSFEERPQETSQWRMRSSNVMPPIEGSACTEDWWGRAADRETFLPARNLCWMTISLSAPRTISTAVLAWETFTKRKSKHREKKAKLELQKLYTLSFFQFESDPICKITSYATFYYTSC